MPYSTLERARLLDGLRDHLQTSGYSAPSLANKTISPHTFRHAAAVALVAAGVDIAVIRSWLGHASIDTTTHYAQANLATQRSALALVTPPTKGGGKPRWRKTEDIVAWLDSL